MGIVIARDDVQSPRIQESFFFSLFEKVFYRLIHPVHAADRDRSLGPHAFGHILIRNAIVRIGLVHIQGLCHQEELFVPVFLQIFQGNIVHDVIVEAPAACAGVPHTADVLLGHVGFHAELGRILAVFVIVLPAGGTQEHAVIAGLLHGPVKRRLTGTRQIPIVDQLGPESRVEALRRRHGG